MRRNIYKNLLDWKKSDRRKPLIMRGARQTGKTYIVQEFGKNEYRNFIYINFELKNQLTELLSQKMSVKQILETIEIVTGKKIIPGETLLFFDEIQEAPLILQSLKYFCENSNEYHIIAAGSLLGIILSNTTSFPVGKVNFLDMNPLTFEEFIIALGEDRLLATLPNKIKNLSCKKFLFHNLLIKYLKLYYYIGGMPEVVADYIKNKDLKRVRKIQIELIDTYLNDFSKHTTKRDAIKIRQIWDSIPIHLGKENKVFIFSAIKSSARGKDYEIAIQWLLDAGLIIKVNNISKPNIPLLAYKKEQFKVYLLDVGLLGAITKLSQKTIVLGDDLFTHFKGSLVENYAMQVVKGNHKVSYYWSNRGEAEVDLILELEDEVYPIEIKAGINLKAKSLKVFDKQFNPNKMLRFSLSNFNKGDRIIDVPIYAFDKLIKDDEIL